MTDKLKINNSTLRIYKGDITDFDIESFVFYARGDLLLGSGYGTAISVRGGPSIQEELNKIGRLEPTQAVMTAAGDMKSKYIIHAHGPKFQEADLPAKLEKTIINALRLADEKGIKAVAFPPMGAGFYGVPLDQSASLTLSTIKSYLSGKTGIQDVVICLMDSREYTPFAKKLSEMI